jgi:amphiphysin
MAPLAQDVQDAPFRATVLEPIGKMCSYFPEVSKSIEKRNKKLSA